jgi:hypothetical protein
MPRKLAAAAAEVPIPAKPHDVFIKKLRRFMTMFLSWQDAEQPSPRDVAAILHRHNPGGSHAIVAT